MNPRRPAARTRICLACRSVFDETGSCPGHGPHRTVSLREESGRRALGDEIWGPDSRARKARQAARAGASGAGIGFLEGCSGCDAGFGGDLFSEILLVVAVIAIAAGLAVVLYRAIRALSFWIREKLHRPKPHGALSKAPRPASQVLAGRGTVRSGTPIALPWSAGSAFAYAMELYDARPFGGGAMLREAVCADLEVQLDDGRTLRLPAGVMRVLGRLPRVEGDRTRLEGHLGGLVPGEESDHLFPFDYARALTLGPGDRVEVFGELTHDREGVAGGYRAGASTLIPVGVPVLRVVSGTEARLPTPPSRDDDAWAEAEVESVHSEPNRARR